MGIFYHFIEPKFISPQESLFSWSASAIWLYLLWLLCSSQKVTTQSNHRFIKNCHIWNWRGVYPVSTWFFNWMFHFGLFGKKPDDFLLEALGYIQVCFSSIKVCCHLKWNKMLCLFCRLLDNNKIDHLPPNIFQHTKVTGSLWVTETTTVTEVMRNCFHHLFRNIHMLKALDMSRKRHIRERKLPNKLTIKKNIYLNGVWLYGQKTKITTLLLKKWT